MRSTRSPRIVIEDLPALAPLSEAEMAKIFGAAFQRFRPRLEVLEDRFMPAALTTAPLAQRWLADTPIQIKSTYAPVTNVDLLSNNTANSPTAAPVASAAQTKATLVLEGFGPIAISSFTPPAVTGKGVQEMHFTADISRTSPALMVAAAQNQTFATATLTVVSQNRVYRYQFSMVTVASYQGGNATVSFTLTFSNVQITNNPTSVP